METIRTLFKTRMDLDTQRPASLAAVSSAGSAAFCGLRHCSDGRRVPDLH